MRTLLAIQVAGDCMAPALRDGQIILVDTDPARRAAVGDIVVWIHPGTGGVMVKRLAERDGWLWFVRDDTGHEVFGGDPDCARALVLGVVAGVAADAGC